MLKSGRFLLNIGNMGSSKAKGDRRRKKTVSELFLAILVILGNSSNFGLARPDKVDLRLLLPAPEEFKGWRTEDAEHVFEGKELFAYIDGGAEIYFEYGFRRVLVQDYRDVQGHRLCLEVFDMDSPESAYGIFSFKKSDSGKPIDIGDKAHLDDYYLNVWKGHFLITISGLDKHAKTLAALQELGQLVAGKIEGRGPRPDLLSLYPEEGLILQSIKLFKGPLGLFNSYPFFQRYVFATSRAARADYGGGESVYLFEYPDEPSCLRTWKEVKEAFFQSDRYLNPFDDGVILRVTDRQGRRIFGGVRKNYLILIINSKDYHAAIEFLNRLEQRMAR